MSGVLLRLRPVVHATPTGNGVHVRGWRSSFTLDGGRGLWTIWERLAAPLADGVPPERLVAPEGAAPVVARALELLIGQLREHDLLVEVPAGWGGGGDGQPPPDVAGWLESVAARPVEAWGLLRAARAEVVGEGVLAAAARRALVATGVEVAAVRPGRGCWSWWGRTRSPAGARGTWASWSRPARSARCWPTRRVSPSGSRVGRGNRRRCWRRWSRRPPRTGWCARWAGCPIRRPRWWTCGTTCRRAARRSRRCWWRGWTRCARSTTRGCRWSGRARRAGCRWRWWGTRSSGRWRRRCPARCRNCR
ncbi:hypothetical protein APASM_3806 [Actinosynnema pretiosum subsp. pretiosum]|nr:hypothetical protein APASM_3806 [Actinosynnema pretiosum subsp. pretiosum]